MASSTGVLCELLLRSPHINPSPTIPIPPIPRARQKLNTTENATPSVWIVFTPASEYMALVCEYMAQVCEYMALVCEYMALVCEYMALVCEHMALVCEYMALVCEYMALACEHMALVCEYMALVCEYNRECHDTTHIN
jgi:hypothetical protein